MHDDRILHPLTADGIDCYSLGDEIVLFSIQAQRLYRLNQTAAFIWQYLTEGFTELEVAQRLADTFGVSAATAHKDVVSIIEDWRRVGLFSDSQTITDLDEPSTLQTTYSETSGYHVGQDSTPDVYPLPQRRQTYRLLGTYIEIGFSDAEVERWVAPVTQHLKTTEETPADIFLDVVTTPHGYAVLRDSVVIADRLQLDQIAPYIHTELIVAAYDATECFIAIHSATLCNNGRCVLLPGVSGSGKSTLTAALVGAGFEYCTDELTLITQQSYGVRPFPICLGIKEGSWPVLENIFPDINKLPCHIRRDQKRVRYMPPPKQFHKGHAAEGLPVHCVIFPTYQENSSTIITPINAADALCRIADAGYDITGGMDTAFVSELVDWVSGLTCYELRYSSLQEAIEQVKSLVR